MPLNGYQAIPVKNFGGLVTNTDPTNLPYWASPDTQDCEYTPGLVQTRPGLVSVYPTLSGNPTINYLKTYINPNQLLRTLLLDSLGTLWKEDASAVPGVLSAVATNILPNTYGNSVSEFTREYIAIGDGKIGVDLPREFTDAHLDRFTRGGPGAPPTATDDTVSFGIVATPGGIIPYAASAIVAGPNGATQNGFLTTITTTAPLPTQLQAGDSVVVAGVGVGGYNGTWVILNIITSTKFTYQNTVQGLANSGGGTSQFPLYTINTTTAISDFSVGQSVLIAGATVINGTWKIRSLDGASAFTISTASVFSVAGGNGTITSAGNIVSGAHKVVVMFVTRDGTITFPSPPFTWTAIGGHRVRLDNIPTGSTDVVQRIVAFTPVNSATFYYTDSGSPIFSGSMIIPDNSTTGGYFDFTEPSLLSGVDISNLFNLIKLPEIAGITSYSSRIATWSGFNTINNFLNLGFDGGFSSFFHSSRNVPLGWIPDAANYGGGQIGGGLFDPISGTTSYRILGDGVTAVRGLITQSASQDTLGNPILSPATSYSISVRLANPSGGVPFTQGILHIELFSASSGITNGFTISCNALTTSFAKYTGIMSVALNSIPSDLLLRIYVDGTPNIGAQVDITELEIFPTNQPTENSIVRLSRTEDPASFDGVDGFLQPSQENGQSVRCCFQIRDFFYIAKERSLFVTADDGQTEPANWTIREVSSKVGTLSVRGVGLGDEWGIIASEYGAYYFDGGALNEQNKLSKEIQPTWDQINWKFGHRITVKVDTLKKRAYFAVPFGTSTVPNKVIVLDYLEGFGQMQEGVGRKWNIWNINANSMDFILRNDLTMPLFVGNSNGTGIVSKLTDGVFSDSQGAGIVTASDNFTRPDENPLNPAVWTQFSPYPVSCKVLSNVCASTTVSSTAGELYTGTSFPPDQIVSFTVGTLTAGNVIGVLGRATALSGAYTAQLSGPLGAGVTLILGRVTYAPLVGFSLGTFVGTINTGDVISLSMLGTTISVKLNGVTVISVTNSVLTSGGSGLFIDVFDAVPNATILNWSAGSFDLAINSFWESGFFQGETRLSFDSMVANIIGSGTCNLLLRKGNMGWLTALRAWTLNALGFNNMERKFPAKMDTSQLSVRIGTNAVGDHFSLQGLNVYAKESTFAPVRGVNF